VGGDRYGQHGDCEDAAVEFVIAAALDAKMVIENLWDRAEDCKYTRLSVDLRHCLIRQRQQAETNASRSAGSLL
jgi:hypothetical protein